MNGACTNLKPLEFTAHFSQKGIEWHTEEEINRLNITDHYNAPRVLFKVIEMAEKETILDLQYP